MKTDLGSVILSAVAVVSGVIVLLGAFLPISPLAELRALLLDWAMILTAVAGVVGVVYLLGLHWSRLRQGQKGAAGSAAMLAAFAITLAVIFLSGGPVGGGSLWLYNHVLVPIESSLTALLAVTLIIAFSRMFARKLSLPRLIFAVVVVFVLITAVALPAIDIWGLRDLRAWLVNVWAVAGARGILLGIALGAAAAGLRILFGAERPYGR